jgi:o-succinylbenzoate synthase
VKLEARPYRLRLATTVRGAAERSGFVVRVIDGERVGLGEAAIVPEVGTETFAEAEQALLRAPLRLDELDALARFPAARHGIELALLDLAAQREGVVLARLLAPQAPLEVPVSALLVAHAMPELAREARRAAEEGFRTVKIKIALDDGYARAAVVRDAVGPAVRLRVDANGAWTREQALRMLHALAPLDIELCEQPTALLEGLEDSPVTIAADELLAAAPELALQRAQVMVLKPMALGGLLPALRWAARARELGRAVVVTTSLDGAIARAGAAHLAAALLATAQPAAAPLAAGLATGRLLLEDVCADPLAPRGGVVALRAVAGLGLS